LGVGLEVCLERVPEIHECALRREDLQSAQEILVTSGARGAVPVAELEGRALPSVGAGGLAARLQEALAD
jgi:branched-subunit amino acid aminotransferase/4-amino-4-deoxychorismate lyase